MKTNKAKTLLTLTAGGLLCASTWLASSSVNPVSAFEKVQGQDKTGKNCERVDTPGSSTFGKCENVCKDKDVTRDAPNNRWVCTASRTVNTSTGAGRAPLSDKAQNATANPTKPPKLTDTKAGKTKKQ